MEQVPSSASAVVYRKHRAGDIGHIIARHGAIYYQEYGWGPSFELIVARIGADFLENYDPAREQCLIAERGDGHILGTVMLVADKTRPSTARLRVLLVERAARGLGVGRALVQRSLDFARTVGYAHVVLSTQSNLRPAHQLYESFGFRMTQQKTEPNEFSLDTFEQFWEMSLDDPAAVSPVA
ncbi:acyl-CoA N-acyltransferase [Xylariales sp. PMI_506]|nr:acyl-CoA N-acyltransferase [Xylariales sp. PMI_506]